MKSRFEEMGSFFDARVEGYDEHMLGMFKDYDHYYETVADQIAKTNQKLKILDLGCGAGAELPWIFKRAPHSHITAIDLSEQMLKKLAEKFVRYEEKLTIIHDSYLTYPFEEKYYDYAVSVYTMHHFNEKNKQQVYNKIKSALKPGGKYIEGDCVTTADNYEQLWAWYRKNYAEEELRAAYHPNDKLYHFDIPFTIEMQIGLLHEAGFSKVDVIRYREDDDATIFIAE